jgi:hypothetical protein
LRGDVNAFQQRQAFDDMKTSRAENDHRKNRKRRVAEPLFGARR